MNAAVQAPTFDQWLARARQAAQQPPARPRQPLVVAGQVVGSVAAGFFDQIGLKRLIHKRYQLSETEHSQGRAWHLQAPPEDTTDALNTLAAALRDAGRCGPWRDEQLAVTNPAGQVVGTVERGAVRVLGIATRAVHLVGLAPDGRMWVQKRSLTKPNNPGLWDTLMGGMVSAADTVETALARETWEEAGLHVADLQALRYGGKLVTRRPAADGNGAGYVVETIDWYCCTVPEGLVPVNQDGEVEQFALMDPPAMLAAMQRGEFTTEAALILADVLGLP